MSYRPRHRQPALAIFVAAVLALPAGPALAPAADLVYQVPPEPLVRLVEAPLTPRVSVGPDRQWLLIMERPALPTIAELAEPELRIGGLRMKPRTNGPSRSWTYSAIRLRNLETLEKRPVRGIPEGLRLDDLSWAPDGTRFAFTTTGEENIQLWVAEAATGEAKRLLEARLNAALTSPYRWLADSRTLIAATVPAGRGPAPPEPRAPRGPVVQENLGGKSPARTYQDLLEDPHDEELFEHYLKTQLVRVGIAGGSQEIGPPGIISNYDPSPDGRYLLVETIHRPFSYLVRYERFPTRVEIWDVDGRKLQEIADLPLHESVPVAFGSVPTGPRSFQWRPDAPATLYWTEAQDGGDAAREAEIRDRILTLEAPFSGKPERLIELALRYMGVEWAENGMAFAWEWWWKNRQVRTWIIDPSRPDAEPELLWDRSWQDRYGDPGEFTTRWNQQGRPVVMIAEDGKSAFLEGEGASDEGDRPFLDRIDLTTRETTRLWRSEAPYYEEPVTVMDSSGTRAITRRESRDEQPNYFVRNLRTGKLTQITELPHPHPELRGIHKELVRYRRGDGVQLSGTLYLPPGHDPERDGPRPLLMWAYPTEYKSADDAGQVDDSPYRFNRIGWWSPLAWLTMGYAVFDDPKLPIIGEGDDEPNDTYVKQLVAGAQAAVDEVVRRGVTTRDRIAIGGHSYGAFMVANLLSHSDLFQAGVARSGAYNRTLTPFGFQAEERTFWEAPEIYFAMSPFMHAEKMDEPLLLIHGEADNNSGTYPMQSERYFNALKGLGATARLVMLPHESHGYRGRESVLHVLWETNEWLGRYLRAEEGSVAER